MLSSDEQTFADKWNADLARRLVRHKAHDERFRDKIQAAHSAGVTGADLIPLMKEVRSAQNAWDQCVSQWFHDCRRESLLSKSSFKKTKNL